MPHVTLFIDWSVVSICSWDAVAEPTLQITRTVNTLMKQEAIR